MYSLVHLSLFCWVLLDAASVGVGFTTFIVAYADPRAENVIATLLSCTRLGDFGPMRHVWVHAITSESCVDAVAQCRLAVAVLSLFCRLLMVPLRRTLLDSVVDVDRVCPYGVQCFGTDRGITVVRALFEAWTTIRRTPSFRCPSIGFSKASCLVSAPWSPLLL